MTRRSEAYWTLFALTAVFYVAIMAWSLPKISAEAGGLTPFDLRPGGYSFDEAAGFLRALSPNGADFYLNVQQRLDTVYPALCAAVLLFGIYLVAPANWGGWRWVLALVALPTAIFDYLENAAVADMLRRGPDGTTPQIVARASQWTVLKSLATAAAGTALLILLVWWAVRAIRRRRRSIAQ